MHRGYLAVKNLLFYYLVWVVVAACVNVSQSISTSTTVAGGDGHVVDDDGDDDVRVLPEPSLPHYYDEDVDDDDDRDTQNPPWPATYNLTQSLITMQCNSSGWSSVERGAQFGIVSYDWSNNKVAWAAHKPMNCEELLWKQAQQTKQQALAVNGNPSATRVFVYRNIVKALPWFTTVREKLQDPAYSGFFLPFAAVATTSTTTSSTFSFAEPSDANNNYHVPPCAAENASHCNFALYHDQEQTPQVPTSQNPNPDGRCVD